MDTVLLLHLLARLTRATFTGLADNDLPGGLAVTAVLLVSIAVWSLAGARQGRPARTI